MAVEGTCQQFSVTEAKAKKLLKTGGVVKA
jgi:hypothetical protein